MRLDHLLSREKARVEMLELIPRSILTAAMGLVKKEVAKLPERTVRFKEIVVSVCPISFSGLVALGAAGLPKASPGSCLRDQISGTGSGRGALVYLDNCI